MVHRLRERTGRRVTADGRVTTGEIFSLNRPLTSPAREAPEGAEESQTAQRQLLADARAAIEAQPAGPGLELDRNALDDAAQQIDLQRQFFQSYAQDACEADRFEAPTCTRLALDVMGNVTEPANRDLPYLGKILDEATSGLPSSYSDTLAGSTEMQMLNSRIVNDSATVAALSDCWFRANDPPMPTLNGD